MAKRKLWKKVVALALAGVMFFGDGAVTGSLGLGAETVYAAETISKMEYFDASNGPELTLEGVGSVTFGFVMPKFNGKPSQQLDLNGVIGDLQLQVKQKNGTGNQWKNIEEVPYFLYNSTWAWEYQSSWDGWICWFKVTETTEIRFHGKTNNVNLDYKLNFKTYDSFNLTAYPGTSTTLDAKGSKEGSIGLCLPQVGGNNVNGSVANMFTYEVCVGAKYNNGNWSGGNWVKLTDEASGWTYKENGANPYSTELQWGYWVDTIYGLWFQPIKEDTYLRIGFPENGQEGGSIGNNYIYYTLLGNPDATTGKAEDMGDIQVDLSDAEPTGDVSQADAIKATPDGWNLIWHDEFNGNALDTKNWTQQTGYFLKEEDGGTWGWGNYEREWYSDSEKNTSVSGGKLNLTMLNEPKVFEAKDGQRMEAFYSSGKIVTQGKFSVKYGRVDFRAKLPDGVGVWPALWMMPNDNVYGEWASSGEIDVMEGCGRTPEKAFGTIHYGGTWPENHYTGTTMDMTKDGNKKSNLTNWHVYSVVWEEGNIRIYADGVCYFKATSDQWFSNGAIDNKNAPFDQRFYIILNLAAGGNFDDLREPDRNTFSRADMYVDYVRVYQRAATTSEGEKNDDAKWNSTGKDDGLYGDYKLNGPSVITPSVDPVVTEWKADGTKIEAEAGTRSGSATTTDAASCSGGKYLGDVGGPNSGAASYTVKADEAGDYIVSVTQCTYEDRPLTIKVNGTEYTVNCPATGDWNKPTTTPVEVRVKLNAGANEIVLTGSGDAYAPNIDCFKVTKAPQEDPALTAAKQALEKAKADAKATFEAGQKNYTDDSWKAFTTAYNNAVNAAVNADAAALNSLANALNDAKGKLVELPEQTETEQKPSESEQKPTETEQKPSESEQKPTETEQKPSESEQKPTETEQKPSETEQKPSESEQKPTESEQKPTETEQKPTETDKTPAPLTEAEKQLVSKLGVTQETAKKISALAAQNNIAADTLLITDASIMGLKNDNDVKGSSFAGLQARASKLKKNSIKLKWNKVSGADGYVIYSNKCGKKNSYQMIADVKNKTSYTQKGLKKGTSYKYIVRAYKVVDGIKVSMAASKTIHAVTTGGKYGVANKVAVKKSNVRLTLGKSFKLGAKEVNKKQKIKKHRKLKYESTNTKIAKVSKSGKITAAGKGTCHVYVYAQNGVYKKVKVTVN